MIQIDSVINWHGDEWEVCFRYGGIRRTTTYPSRYRPSNRELVAYIKELLDL